MVTVKESCGADPATVAPWQEGWCNAARSGVGTHSLGRHLPFVNFIRAPLLLGELRAWASCTPPESGRECQQSVRQKWKISLCLGMHAEAPERAEAQLRCRTAYRYLGRDGVTFLWVGIKIQVKAWVFLLPGDH